MEAEAENLEIAQIVEALLKDDILERHPDTGQGESCLIVGFSNDTLIHVVCGMRADNLNIVTVLCPWSSEIYRSLNESRCMMAKKTEIQKCYYRGDEQFEERRVRYIYGRQGHDHYVPDMPADVCLKYGSIHYHGTALLKVEQQFKAIFRDNEQPDRYDTMPVMGYAE